VTDGLVLPTLRRAREADSWRRRSRRGDGAIQGVGSLGEINAKSYGVYDRGDRLVFGGGVSTRLEPRSGP